MKKTVLVPTDFSLESLKMVKALLTASQGGPKYDLIFLHGIHLSDSITDFIFYSKTKMIRSLSNQSFEEACAVLKNKFISHIHSIRKDIFTGSTQSAFEHYLLANNIDEAFIPAQYQLIPANKNSFDLIPFIKKSDLKKNEIEWEVTDKDEREKLAEIFFSDASKK